MTTKSKMSGTQRASKKLKLKKETLKDLNVKGSGKDVKGGLMAKSAACETLTYCGTQCMCNPSDFCRKP